MTSYLYYSISSKLTEREKHKIDLKLKHERRIIYSFMGNLPKKWKSKIKQVTVYSIKTIKRVTVSGLIVFGFSKSLPTQKCAPMGMPLTWYILFDLQSPNIQQRYLKTSQKFLPSAAINIDRITLNNLKIKEFDIIYAKFCNGNLNREETILALRAGGFYDWANLAFVVALIMLSQAK